MVGVPHSGACSICGGSFIIKQGKQKDDKANEREGDTMKKRLLQSAVSLAAAGGRLEGKWQKGLAIPFMIRN